MHLHLHKNNFNAKDYIKHIKLSKNPLIIKTKLRINGVQSDQNKITQPTTLGMIDHAAGFKLKNVIDFMNCIEHV